MPKNIKQREKYKLNPNSQDKRKQYTSRMKRSMINQYKKSKREKEDREDRENPNATNYAITKTVRTGNRGGTDGIYVIGTATKKVHRQIRNRINEHKIKMKEQEENQIESYRPIKSKENLEQQRKIEYEKRIQEYPQEYTTNNSTENSITNIENNFENQKAKRINEYQKTKLIKEKQDYKNIKERSVKENNIKERTNDIKIKTRESENQLRNSAKDMTAIKNNSNHLMKKSNIQKTKDETHKLKEKTKKAGTAVANNGKRVAKGIKGAGALLGAGGGFVLFLMIVIIMVAGIFKSMFGIFFTKETSSKNKNSMTVETAIEELKDSVDDKIDSIKQKVSYDKVVVSRDQIKWKEILAIYAVVTSNREDIDLTTLDKKAYKKLKSIFNDVVDVDYSTSTYYVTKTKIVDGEEVKYKVSRKKLSISVNCMSFEAMVKKYDLSESEYNQALEILKSDYDGMWEDILEDIH